MIFGYNEESVAIAHELYKAGFVRQSKEGFSLRVHDRHPDAPKPLVYFKFPSTISEDLLRMVTKAFQKLVDYAGAEFDAIAGVPNSGNPLARALCDESIADLIVLDKEHMTIRGSLSARPPYGSRVLLIENMITSGGSVLKAVNTLRFEGYKVRNVLSLVTWDIAKPRLNRNSIYESSLFTVKELLSMGVKMNLVERDVFESAGQFCKFIQRLP